VDPRHAFLAFMTLEVYKSVGRGLQRALEAEQKVAPSEWVGAMGMKEIYSEIAGLFTLQAVTYGNFMLLTESGV